jgi:hypothetical protein
VRSHVCRRVNEGTVISTDQSIVFKINENNVALIVDDLDSGRSFCEQYLKRFESTKAGFDEIILEASESLKKECKSI